MQFFSDYRVAGECARDEARRGVTASRGGRWKFGKCGERAEGPARFKARVSTPPEWGMPYLSFMAALIDAIDVKRRTRFELDNTPYACLEVEVNTPTARGGQTLVRLKMRNLLTSAVFDRTFKAGEKFKEPDLQTVSASYLYNDGSGYHFLDQETFETHSLNGTVMGNAVDFLTEGLVIELLKYNGNPIGVELPANVTLQVAFTEPGLRGDSSS